MKIFITNVKWYTIMKNKIISREWIHPDFKLYTKESNEYFSRSEIVNFIDKWKVFLKSSIGIKAGLTIGLCVSVMDHRYFSLFFAAAELGLKFVVFQRPEVDTDLENYKLTIFKPIDYIVYDNLNIDNVLIKKFIDEFSVVQFSINALDSIVNVNESTIANNIEANNNSEILLTTSSGTTDRPKIISHTHEFFYDLCKRNARVMQFKSEDKVLHIRNLHHGSSLGIFFLPSLLACEHHYSSNYEHNDTTSLLSALNDYGITKLSVPCNSVVDCIINSNNQYKDLTIYNLSYLQQEWIQACRDGKIKQVVSIFGCNETSGPIFTPSIDKDTVNFDPANLGPLTDKYYDTKIENNTLHVYLSTYDKWNSTGDVFDIDNGDYIFKGKDQVIRINDVLIKTEEIKRIARDYINEEHIVIFDQECEAIYLAMFDIEQAHIGWHKDLNKKIASVISPNVQISKALYFVKESILYGIKPDFEKMRAEFRKNNDQSN